MVAQVYILTKLSEYMHGCGVEYVGFLAHAWGRRRTLGVEGMQGTRGCRIVRSCSVTWEWMKTWEVVDVGRWHEWRM